MILAVVKPNAYFDSVTLLQVSAKLGGLAGVSRASVVMGTELNRQVLRDSGLATGDTDAAGANDLILAVSAAEEPRAKAALAAAEELLAARRGSAGPAGEQAPRGIRSAIQRAGVANLAFISVPGPYAAAEAWQALSAGLHVFLFSDNVPLADEVALKRYASRRGLLVMGPDCGTAILNGAGLGFANAVRRGEVGIAGSSGTGMQEVAALVHQRGGGISHAIGTGSRDLHQEVGGLTTLQALELLAADPATKTVVLVSKPPSDAVARRVLEAASRTGKRVIACLLGWSGNLPGVERADTLEDAARLAMGELPLGLRARAAKPTVFGAYCGGTLAHEARLLLPGADIVDFGEDEYTRGRAHPMIDPTLRNQAIGESKAELILLDVILGSGSVADPAGALRPVVQACPTKRFWAHLLGTELDAQGLAAQRQALEREGVTVFESNAAMAWAAAGEAA